MTEIILQNPSSSQIEFMRNIISSLYVLNKVSIFLIRVKDITSNGILSTISFEEYEDEFDIDIVRTLTRKQTKEVKDNPDRYVRIMSSSPDFEFLPIDKDYYVLPLRVIRFKITLTMKAPKERN